MMRKLKTLKNLREGDLVAWRCICNLYPPTTSHPIPYWSCILKTKRVIKKVKYTPQNNSYGHVYTIHSTLLFENICSNRLGEVDRSLFFNKSFANQYLNSIGYLTCPVTFEEDEWEVYLLENQGEVLNISKRIMVDNL